MAGDEHRTAPGRSRAARAAAAHDVDLEPVAEPDRDGAAPRPGADRATRAGARVEGGPGADVGSATRLGGRRAPATASRGPIRPAPAWQAPPGRRRPRRGGLLAALLTVAVAIAVAYLLSRPDPLRVTGASVAPAVDPGGSCDVTVDVVGTVTTDGRPGALTYQWLRSDGQASQELSQSVADGATSTQVHLMWTFSGSGTYPATATLRVLRPDRLDAVGHFTYSCR